MVETQDKRLDIFSFSLEDKVFLLDFDGTMVGLSPDPSVIDVPDALMHDLGRISAADDGRMAIVSGRTISQLDGFLPGVFMPAVGSHGAEMRPRRGGQMEILSGPLPQSVREALFGLSSRKACLFEDKIYCLSIHLPFERKDEDMCAEIKSTMGDEGKGLVVRKTGRTYEIVKDNVSKGTGISALMHMPGFTGRTPVYIGDDACVDDSLSVVDEMGGMLFHVHASHDVNPLAGSMGDLIAMKDVGYLISKLARI